MAAGSGWRLPPEQGLRGDDDPGEAEAALRGVGLDEGAADGRVEPRGRLDVTILDRATGKRAGVGRNAVHQHPAGAALFASATDLRRHVRDWRTAQGVDERASQRLRQAGRPGGR